MIPVKLVPYALAGVATLGLATFLGLWVREREKRAEAEGRAQIQVKWDSAMVHARTEALDSALVFAARLGRRVDTVRLQVVEHFIPTSTATLDSIRKVLTDGSPLDSAMRALLLRGVARSDSLGQACTALANDCGQLRTALADIQPKYDALRFAYDSLVRHGIGIPSGKGPRLHIGIGATAGPCLTKGGLQPVCATVGLTGTIPLRR